MEEDGEDVKRRHWTVPRAVYVLAAGNENEVNDLLRNSGEAITTKWRDLTGQTKKAAAPRNVK
jgi:hypothetical protein